MCRLKQKNKENLRKFYREFLKIFFVFFILICIFCCSIYTFRFNYDEVALKHFLKFTVKFSLKLGHFLVQI